ncbi:MAG: hypothetical protein II886_12810 [Prevotella sp.]|nr:hypothetical protein [Prevotella sp.]
MKRQYIKPTVRVVKLQHRSHILAGSTKSVRSVANSEDITWKSDGFEDDEDDY